MWCGLRGSSCLATDDDSEEDDDDDDELDNWVLSRPSTVLSATILQGRVAPDPLPSLTTTLTS